MYALNYDKDEVPEFKAIGVTNSQGAPLLAIVTIKNSTLVSTHYIDPTSSHSTEIKALLLGLLERVLK